MTSVLNHQSDRSPCRCEYVSTKWSRQVVSLETGMANGLSSVRQNWASLGKTENCKWNHKWLNYTSAWPTVFTCQPLILPLYGMYNTICMCTPCLMCTLTRLLQRSLIFSTLTTTKPEKIVIYNSSLMKCSHNNLRCSSMKIHLGF